MGFADAMKARNGGDNNPSMGFGYYKEQGEANMKPREDQFAGLKPIVKELSSPQKAQISAEEIEQLRLSLDQISVKPANEEDAVEIPPPVQSFEEGVIGNEALLGQFKKNGFSKPSPIQAQMWPIILSGLDCIGVSQTGSGKTLAFLVPAFLHLDAQLKQYAPGELRPCPSILVITPTRELALQIEDEVKKYSYNGYKSVCLYGGAGMREQRESCAAGGSISLKTVTYVVLDEADRMLDLGFDHDISRIMCEIRPDRITVLTSATWPEGVSSMAKKYLKKAAMCIVGSLDLTACKKVTQYFMYVDNEKEKDATLLQQINFLLETYKQNFKLLVFVSRKVYADHVASDLCVAGVSAQAMHGGRSQMDREATLKSFREGRVQILVATDLASRGIDVPDITHVINYDFPGEIEEYVHRVGRTGRAGKSGEAMTYMSYQDKHSAAQLIDILEKSGQVIPDFLPKMAEQWKIRLERGGGGFRGRGRGRF
ncbi:unnamed protein product, partial [Mesorhabditis spiculigera]